MSSAPALASEFLASLPSKLARFMGLLERLLLFGDFWSEGLCILTGLAEVSLSVIAALEVAEAGVSEDLVVGLAVVLVTAGFVVLVAVAITIYSFVVCITLTYS